MLSQISNNLFIISTDPKHCFINTQPQYEVFIYPDNLAANYDKVTMKNLLGRDLV